MSIAFWIVNGLLALAFLGAGGMKLARDKAALRESGMTWVDDFSGTAVKLIGLVEVLGAIGLVVPPLVDVAPVLAPIAAIGLVLTMVGAVVVHQRRQEPVVPPLVLGALAVVSAVLGVAVL